MDDSGSGKAYGRGYTFANVTLSGGGGTGATARPILAPFKGIGGDPRDDLRSSALMFNTRLEGTENNALITSNDFRQVGLIKNPVETDSASSGNLFNALAGNSLNKLKFGSIAQSFTEDKTIQGSTSTAQAYVDKADSNYVWYHQSDSTGFLLFSEGETITELDGNGEGILDSAANDPDTDAFTKSTVKPFSGELLYVDNRAAIERDPNQTEDIKVIIQL